jgi:hypothetical protein
VDIQDLINSLTSLASRRIPTDDRISALDWLDAVKDKFDPGIDQLVLGVKDADPIADTRIPRVCIPEDENGVSD